MSYLILDSNSVWGRLKRIENDNGRSVKEYTGLVLQDIAREIVYYSIAAKASQTKDTDRSMVPSVKTVSDSTAPFLLRRIALEKLDKGELRFYTRTMLDDKETCREIYRIMRDIRLGERKPDQTWNDPRLADLKLLLDSYESYLRDNGMYDAVRLLCDAAAAMKDDDLRR